MPSLLDLTWKSNATTPTLPDDVYPVLAPAIYRGDSYSITFTLLNGEDPYEPEGELFAQIRPGRLAASATPGDPIAEFAVTVDVNEVTIALTDDETLDIPDSGYWDLQERLDADTVRTWFTGKVKAWGDVTREAGS